MRNGAARKGRAVFLRLESISGDGDIPRQKQSEMVRSLCQKGDGDLNGLDKQNFQRLLWRTETADRLIPSFRIKVLRRFDLRR